MLIQTEEGQRAYRNIVGTVPPFQFDSLGPTSERKKLMTQADAHDGNLRSVHERTQGIDRILAMSRISRTVGDEDAVEEVGNFLDGIVEGEASHARATVDEGAKDVFFDAAIDDGDVQISIAIR